MTELQDSTDLSSRRLSTVLGALAAAAPDRDALVFLEDGQAESGRLSRARLQRQSMQVAAALRERGMVGERVLLAFHSSLEYVVAFLGCLHAGVVAVPVYPPRQNWHARRLVTIARDAGAALVLTSDALCDEVGTRLRVEADLPSREPSQGGLLTLGIGALLPGQGVGAEAWTNDAVALSAPAYLQYTSGSTGDPKGVMVSHANLMANIAFIAESAGLGGGGAFVSWLPIYHDMGLVAGILLPLVLGATAVFMPPAAFVQQPLDWLRAIDRYRGRFSAAPNFAYDLCVSRSTPEQVAGLDLRCWEVALNGAEPLWSGTLDSFQARFEPAGVRPGLISGGYGLAEATLVVTIGARDEVAPRLHVDRAALEQHRIVPVQGPGPGGATVVSSGRVRPGFEVRIVDAQCGVLVDDAAVGEIWVNGASVAGGYWRRPQSTDETFGARLPQAPQRRWLRTGDLGFVRDGQLYVTGRLKDLLIVRGANHYPQDLERTAEQAYPGLRRGGYGAAFTTEGAGAEPLLVLVQEVDRAARRQIDVTAAARAVADAVTREHGVEVDRVVLVPPATVPKTSSGKVQRRACQAALAAGEWTELGRWERPADAAPLPARLQAGPPTDLQQWLRECVASLAAREVRDIDATRPLLDLGLDSMKLVELTARAAAELGIRLAPTVAFDHPSIEALARHLECRQGLRQHVGPAAPVQRAQPIAIIGMDCRFPGAEGLQAFWDLLIDGRCAIAEVSPERARRTSWSPAANAPHRFVGLIDAVDRFDAAAFGISPREACSMDPQQRLLLQTAWHALERAHIAPDRLAGSPTGVFVGISGNDYYRIQRAHGMGLEPHAGTGGALSIAANRVSYCFDLRGPSLSVDTACSSSLVALHQACLSLAVGECTLALAGGVNLVLSEDLGTIFDQVGMLAADGRCKTFDAEADGYVRGEGCGVLVLKRLEHALRDGDPVLAVVRASAVNQDGASNGMTAPNGLAQQDVIRCALQRAGLEGAAIDYVETHGTGTRLGDPIEVQALRAALEAGAELPDPVPCWLGAVKTRIGHLEAAAGVAGVIKAVLALRHGVIPANGHFSTLNPAIDLAGSRLRPATVPVVWPARRERPRRAGVSSFGFGGTNAHVILEEAPAVAAGHAAPAVAPLLHRLHTLSAANPAGLRALAAAHARALVAAPDEVAASRLSRVANTGRAQLQERLALCATDTAALAGALHAFARGETLPAGVQHAVGSAPRGPRLAFLFTGQGSQHAGMGAGLFSSEPLFRDALGRCNAVLQPLLGVALEDLLFGDASSRLGDTRYTQPALAALQIALCELWAHYGVRPDVVCGHSVGEYAAAVCSGLMPRDTALRWVVARARLMAEAPGRGAMLSVAAGEAQVLAALASLAPLIEVAACNSPRQTVLSGDEAVVCDALALLQAKGLLATRLAVSHAFHSRLMAPVQAEFGRVLAEDGRIFTAPRLRMVSTGGSVAADLRNPAYWVEQIRRPVCFAEALCELDRQGVRAFIEIGPSSTLLSLARDTLGSGVRIASLGGAVHDAGQSLRAALGAWWAAGGSPQLDRLPGPVANEPVDLPVRVFEPSSHWFEVPDPAEALRPAEALGALPQCPVDLADAGVRAFDTLLAGASLDWLRDHVVAGRAVMPAAGWIALALAALHNTEGGPFSLSDLEFLLPLPLEEGARVQTVLTHEVSGWRLRIARYEASAAHWVDCVRGRGMPLVPMQDADVPLAGGADWIQLRPDDFHAAWTRHGLAYGPAFRLLTDIACRADEAQAGLAVPMAGAAAAGSLHPAWLDAAFQCVGALLLNEAAQRRCIPMPVRLDHLWMAATQPGAAARVWGRVRERCGQEVVADLWIRASDGSVCLRAQGLHLRWVDTLVAGSEARRRVVAEAQVLTAAYALQVVEVVPPQTLIARDWWVVAETGELARSLSADLHRGGLAAASLPVDLIHAQDWAQALEALQGPASAGRPKGLLVALAPHDGATGDAEALCHGLALCRHLQRLLAGCDAVPLGDHPLAVCLLTRRGSAGAPMLAATPLATAGVAALWRSAAQEFPQLALSQGGLPADMTPADARSLVQALGSDETEWQVCDGRIGVPRLRRLDPLPARLPVPDGGVLITGGTGALGLHVAQRLVERGVRRLWLVARRPDLPADDLQRLTQWRAMGCRIDLVAADIAHRDQVERVLAQVHAQETPLRGIVHAAGATADAGLHSLDDGHWRAVVDAKVFGALWFDELTRHLSLDFFVAFSSAAVPLGSAGQCHYAAANGWLEALMPRRGGGATVMQWGPWQGAGLAEQKGVRQVLAQRGIGALEAGEALDAFEQALGSGEPVCLLGRFDWTQLAQASALPALPSAWRALVPGRDAPAAVTPAVAAPSLQALSAMEPEQALAAIRSELGTRIAQVLGLHLAQLFTPNNSQGERLRLSSLGLDSLMAMEVRNQVRAWVGVDLPTHLLVGTAEFGEVVKLIHQKVLLRSLSRPQPEGQAGDADVNLQEEVL